MPWWGWLIVGVAGGAVVGGCIGYATALFQVGSGLGG
jgi:hypothetical protein